LNFWQFILLEARQLMLGGMKERGITPSVAGGSS